jgi:hypothetical protein
MFGSRPMSFLFSPEGYTNLFIQLHKKEQQMKLLLFHPYFNLKSSQKALEMAFESLSPV